GLHLAGGTSYWKTSIPKDLRLESGPLSPDDAAFWTEVYTKGLGEFFYRNRIDPTGAARFDGSGRAEAPARARTGDGSALLLWGGGKDSIVSHEALSASGVPHELLTIGRSEWEWVARSATTTRLPYHTVERRLDPKLKEL